MERRFKQVPLSFPFLFEIIKEGFETAEGIKCVSGIPADAKFIWSEVDHGTQIAYLVFYHESFDIVKPGYLIPRITIEHEPIGEK